jgi:hypothetical protein
VAAGLLVGLAGAGAAGAVIFSMTFRDFHLSGTQAGSLVASNFQHSSNCSLCHGNFDTDNSPYETWSGSLMALGGKDPLFFAQMSLANQDVANAGYFCMRCHLPNSYVTGAAHQPDGSTLGAMDLDGVNCHFCHSMVDPIYKPGISPASDLDILAALASVPQYYGNAMFVLDPMGVRRGPRSDAMQVHQVLHSPFHTKGEFCGTCHDVGNVAVTLQPDGTYRYNALDTATPTEDLHQQFPLERTYTEWKLSEFASTGVDMQGRFGGDGATIVSTCQDCHMPRAAAQACFFGDKRPDVRRHDFAGSSAQVLDLINAFLQDDPETDFPAIARGRAKAVDMLQRAATVEVARAGSDLRVRVINESGHKLPTGHIEGRRVWVNVRFFDSGGVLIAEYGRYDYDEAELHGSDTHVYEMLVGLSGDAAGATGLPTGQTGHMALADTIVKDNRIPPRGFNNAAYAAGGAPPVGAVYADGQYWDDVMFPLPTGAARVEAHLYYQNTPRHYIEELRDNNHTDGWGQLLHDLWVQTGRGSPIEITSAQQTLRWTCPGDVDGDGRVDFADITHLLALWGRDHPLADFNDDGVVGFGEVTVVLEEWGSACGPS